MDFSRVKIRYWLVADNRDRIVRKPSMLCWEASLASLVKVGVDVWKMLSGDTEYL